MSKYLDSQVQKLKEFFKKNPSYKRLGAKKTRSKLVDNGIMGFGIKTIKLAKKEMREEASKKVIEKVEFTPELFEKMQKLALEMGIIPLTSTVGTEKKENKKDALPRLIQTPSISDQSGIHILLGCNHVPFHNEQLHRGIIELIKDQGSNVKGFHLLGDFLDINTLSSHDKGKFTAVPGLTLNQEYDAGNELLDDFDKVLPSDCWKTYMYGNHEDRYNRYMRDMQNAKTPLRSPEEALLLNRRGYQVKTSWSQDFFTIGKDFDIFHGIYWNIHNTKQHLDKLKRSCAYVHTHRQSSFVDGDKFAYNIGACANFKAKAFNYASRAMKAQWSNGFAIAFVDGKGRTFIQQIYVTRDGHFVFGGKQY